MAGSPPTVTVTVDQPVYAPGQVVTATIAVADPDTGAEVLDSTDALGRQVSITISRVDPATVVRAWWAAARTDLVVSGLTASGPAPGASDVLVVQVRDGQGNLAIGQTAVTVTPASTPMLVGVNPAAGAGATAAQKLAVFDAHTTRYPGMSYTRVFSSTGIPSFGTPLLAHALIERSAPLAVHVSFKTFDPAALRAWLDALPGGLRVFLTYHHEPEGDLDPALYRAQWQQVRQIRDAHPNAARVTLAAIHTLYWSRHRGDWHQWWPTMPDGSPCADRMGWDCYNDAGRPYEDPASLLALPIAAAREVGVPLMVPELGATLAPGDTGRDRATWIAGCYQVLRQVGCTAVAWWCGIGSQGQDYHLDADPAGLAAWRAVIATQVTG